MPSWDEILKKYNESAVRLPNGTIQIDFDNLRRSYIKRLSKYRKRNVIVYYSDWLNKPGNGFNIEINDNDMIGFMTTIKGLDKNKGLDLIIHTPGGNPLATEGIVNYLHKMFDDIEIFVPHMCMSAGTMLACSSNRIWMGKQSCLGPIDPQFGGIPAYNIKKEFEDAKKQLKENPDGFRYWQIILSKYSPAFYYTILDSIDLSSKLVSQWLNDYMFKNDEDNSKTIIHNIISVLNANTGSHSKHFDYKYCQSIGLKVNKLEDDEKLQDLVLSIYHCCNICGGNTSTIKIIENHLGKSYISNMIPTRN